MNIIIRFTKFRLTLYSVLRFQSTVVVMADQNLLDTINIEDYINKKHDELAMSSLKKELLQEVQLLIQKEESSIISFLQNQNDHFLTEVNFLREEVKKKKQGY